MAPPFTGAYAREVICARGLQQPGAYVMIYSTVGQQMRIRSLGIRQQVTARGEVWRVSTRAAASRCVESPVCRIDIRTISSDTIDEDAIFFTRRYMTEGNMTRSGRPIEN